ncbi:MAG TPA: Holliday junction branch migration protein RuvA [Alphaproteobacteria bacterium]|nr:Holliday junction branch migration protein RuvA [Alphaproteobacteria bacterium]
MIAKLTGILDSTREGQAVIDVGGVGYLVFASARTLGALPPKGQAVSLSIETHVREDHIHLYGFANDVEREWFKLLTTVQGVGAKVGLAILSVLSPNEIAQAIVAGDRTAVARADGVGPKLAQRVVTELKDKAGSIGLSQGAPAGAVFSKPAEGVASEDVELADAISALVNLGYKRVEAFGAVTNASRKIGKKAATAELIRAGLKELGTPT